MIEQPQNPATDNLVDTKDAKAVLELARRSHEKYLIKLQKNDLNNAIDYYIKTIKLDPNMPETYYRLASLLWENGQISLTGAIEQCRSAVHISPKNPNARIYTGYFLRLAKEYEDAEKEFKEAIKINPLSSARARLILSELFLDKLQHSKFDLKYFSKFLYYIGTGTITMIWDYPSLRMIYKNIKENLSILGYKAVGEILESTKNYSLAIKTYDIAAENTGRDELFYNKIGDISIKNEAPEIAIDSYKKALDANPCNRDILIKVATVIQTYFESQVDEAIDCYNKILELEGSNHRVYYELGHLYLKKNDAINAINAFKLAIDLDIENPFYHNSLGYALVKAEQYDEAIEHYQIAINLNPDNEWTSIVCQALGALYYKIKENNEAAISLYQTSIVLDPKSEDSHICIGDIYFENGDIDTSIKYYCESIKINPDNAKAYNKCAMALWEKDYLEESILAYNKAINIKPDYDIAYNNLGVIYLDGIGNIKEAIQNFKIAIEINKEYTLAYFNLGRAYQAQGEKMKAAKNYQKAADLNKISQDINEEDIQERIFGLFEVD